MPPKKVPTTTRRSTRQSTLKADAAPPAKKQKTVKPLSGPPVFDFSFGSQESERALSPAPNPSQSQSRASLSQTQTQTQKQKGLLKLTAASLGHQRPNESQKKKEKDVKGKGKAKAPIQPLDTDGRLWVDIFEPRTESELAVHKRKVADVRGWLGEALDAGKLSKYRRLLVLIGPAGSGKTATVRVLAREMGIDIIEWRNASSTGALASELDASGNSNIHINDDDNDWDSYESTMDKFESFLGRAGSYRTIFAPSTPASASAPSSSATSSQKPTAQPQPKHLILLEDLPNILHAPTRARFHNALRTHIMSPRVGLPPVVVIVSDAGLRGEGNDDGEGTTGWGRAGRREEVVDARNVVPEGVGAAWVTQIAFNPIAPTYMTPALKALLARVKSSTHVPPHIMQTVIEGANGDIRSAVMGLEFACARIGRKDKDKGKRGKEGAAMEAATRKEGALALFHLLGKVLYNKRKGDPPGSNATRKEIERDRALDATLRSEPPVPPWAAAEARAPSRVDVDALYAATPIDASLFGLYVHQNYTQFCDEMEQCAGIADALSWCDANGGEAWYQTNPHTFHLTALSTLHALPSPVPRRAQKTYKPAFFGALAAARDADAALGDTLAWFARRGERWARAEAACELGGILRVGGAGLGVGMGMGGGSGLGAGHRVWSAMPWGGAGGGAEGEVAEEGEGAVGGLVEEMERGLEGVGGGVGGGDGVESTGGWLEEDGIEEWE
ncbi:Rad17-domain-containing protein [Dentipellis sp. KUC8613]|nr:Rad17-domain-containing protein [Dentipellis sp. KUC8613]